MDSGCSIVAWRSCYQVSRTAGVQCAVRLGFADKKDVVVTSRGLEINYQMRITTQYDFWSWDKIVSVTREDKNNPEVVALYFGMDNKAKRLYFTRPVAEQVLKLAKEVKPGITIQEA